jgi:hypothetical protein
MDASVRVFRGPGVGHYCSAVQLTCSCSAAWLQLLEEAAAPCRLHTPEQVENSRPHIATPSFGWQVTARVSHAVCPRPRQLSSPPVALPQLIQPTCVFSLSFLMVCTHSFAKRAPP